MERGGGGGQLKVDTAKQEKRRRQKKKKGFMETRLFRLNASTGRSKANGRKT